MKRSLLGLSVLFLLGFAVGCTDNESGGTKQIDPQFAFTNGGFETDVDQTAPPTGWTVTTYRNDNNSVFGAKGLNAVPPTSTTELNLRSDAGNNATEVRCGAVESVADPELGAGASLKYPKYGSCIGRVNKTNAVLGHNYNANSMQQTMTLGLGDVDPGDGQIHIRFVAAPVLENPAHSNWEQPYFFIQLRNASRNTTLYTDFNFANQPGVPWKSVVGCRTPGVPCLYTDWQLVDVAPGNAAVIGENVELTVYASGCSQGGHFGRVYLDAFGSVIPGIYVTGTGPGNAAANTNITYTLRYKNGGGSTTTNNTVRFRTPLNTTYQSVSLVGCTEPAVDGTGDVSCNVGTLNAGDTGTFTVTVKIDNGTTGTIRAADYDISATGVSPLLGTKVETAITGAPNSISVVSGSGQSANVTANFALPLIAIVKDASNNPIPGVSVTFTPPGVGASAAISGSPAVTNAQGKANVLATANGTIGGPYTVSASVGGVVATADFSLTNTVGPPASIAVVSGNNQSKQVLTGFTNPLKVIVKDAGNNPVPNASVTFTPPGAGASSTLTGSPATTDVNGEASVTATANATAGGPYTVSASVGGVVTTADFSLTNTPGPPSTISIVSGNSQTTEVLTDFAAPLVVIVKDASNNPISGAAVTFTPPGSGASATFAGSTTTDASGQVSVTATANSVAGGPYTVSASTAGVAAPADFSLTNTAGSPASISVVSGSDQSTQVLTDFAAPLVVIVKDASNNPVAGETVTFTPPGSGASATFAGSTTTDASGQVSVTATANSVAGGPYTADASVAGVVASAPFSLTNTAGPPASISAVSGSDQSTQILTDFADPLVVLVKDADDNPVPNFTVSFAAPASGASATFTGPTATDADGLLSVTAKANATEGGPYSVNATVLGVVAPAVFTLTNTVPAIIPTTTTVTTADPSVPIDARPVFRATVSSDFGIPTGTVRFLLDGVEVGTAELVDGVADLAIDLGTLGAHQVTAVFDGSGTFGPSTSDPVGITATQDSGRLNGGGIGCSGSSFGGVMWIVLLIGMILWTRLRCRRSAWLVIAGVAFFATPGAQAQTSPGAAINVFHSAQAGSDWFYLDSLDLRGHLRPAGRFLIDYAVNPLIVYNATGGQRRVVVNDQVWLHLGGALTFLDRFRLSLNVPVAVYQDANATVFNGVRIDPPGNRGLGDLSLAADARLFGVYGDPFTVAVGAKADVPTGSQKDLLGNGRVGAEPYASMAGRIGRIDYSTRLGFAFRDGRIANDNFNKELRFAAAAGMRFFDNRLLVGPEIYGLRDIGPSAGEKRPTGLEIDGGVHYQITPAWKVGLGAGHIVVNSPGFPDLRFFAGLDWMPPIQEKAAVPVAVAAAEPTPTPAPESPARPPTPPAIQKIELIGKVLFDNAKAAIKPVSFPVLDNVVDVLTRHPEIKKVRIEAHTDNRGDDQYNLDLSKRRAASVRKHLIEKGIAEDRMESAGFGETKPIGTNDTREGRAQNRRVEFVIVE